jgi:ferredoxin
MSYKNPAKYIYLSAVLNASLFLIFSSEALAANYRVTIITCDGENTIEVADDQAILDAAEEAAIDLPYSCRSGACSTSAARLVSGRIDQSDQSYLSDEQIAAGFFLFDVARPLSDVVMNVCGAQDALDPQSPPVCP